VSEENVKIVRQFFEARNRGDLAYLEYVDPDAVFDFSESRSPYRGVYRGRDEIREQWEAVREAWTGAEMRPQDPLAVGDHVVVTVTGAARGRTSGIPLRGQGANVYTLKGGKIVRYKLFQTRADALEAVGLRE
jgi:ketosteroid isomerase-like protein